MASLPLPLTFGGLKGDQYRAYLWLGSILDGHFSQNEGRTISDASGITLDQRVLHPKFGEGIVLNFEGVGQQSRVQIQFDDVGAKWLVTAYARLEAL